MSQATAEAAVTWHQAHPAVQGKKLGAIGFSNRPDAFEPESATRAWERTIEFLKRTLRA